MSSTNHKIFLMSIGYREKLEKKNRESIIKIPSLNIYTRFINKGIKPPTIAPMLNPLMWDVMFTLGSINVAMT